MKNRVWCFSLLITFCQVGFTQKNTIATTGKFGTQLIISDVNGQAFTNKYDLIEGSVYDNNAYRVAKITLKDGRIYHDVKSRINLLEHEVNFIDFNGNEGWLGKGMVREISFTEMKEGEQNVKTYQVGFPPIDNQNRISFYQILLTEKLSLLKSVNKSIKELNNEISGERYKEFATHENIYLLKDSVLTRIKKDKSFILTFLKKHAIDVNHYIESQKLNLKNEQDLILLIRYYNGLESTTK